MSWTGRPDDQACCGDEPGAVQPGTMVARLLHDGNHAPPTSGFKRNELHPKPIPNPANNVCGDAAGLSVERSNGLGDDEIRTLARMQAERKPGRASQGAKIALVDDLRAIECEADPQGQAVYVYDDPLTDNRRHAVIRISEHVHPGDFSFYRDRVMEAFRIIISP